jgi:hypothetical protein
MIGFEVASLRDAFSCRLFFKRFFFSCDIVVTISVLHCARKQKEADRSTKIKTKKEKRK